MAKVPYFGRVSLDERIENELDSFRAHRDEIPNSDVRTVRFSVAELTNGRASVGLPSKMLRQLGFDKPFSSRGVDGVPRYGPVRLWIGDRDMLLEATELPYNSLVHIGRIPIEYMQYVVDMTNHKLVPSPANGGQWILDMF